MERCGCVREVDLEGNTPQGSSLHQTLRMGPLYPPRARKGAQGMAGCVAPVAILVVVPPCTSRPAARRPPRAPRPRGPARPTSHTRALDRWPTPCAVRVLLRQSFSCRDAVLYSTTACKSSLHRTGELRGSRGSSRAHRRSFLTERMTGREWMSNPFYPRAFAWANEGPPVLRVYTRPSSRRDEKQNKLHSRRHAQTADGTTTRRRREQHGPGGFGHKLLTSSKLLARSKYLK